MSLFELTAVSGGTYAHYPGVYAGSVTDVRDPLKSGRVKVMVPSIFVDQDTWARPCFAYGHFFVPEVGDHVWVAFEGGDTSAPVWLGVWYPSGAAPQPSADASPPDQRQVRTPSGHTLMFDDGTKTLRIEDATGNYVELSSDAVTIHAEKPLKIQAPGQPVTVVAKSFDVTKG